MDNKQKKVRGTATFYGDGSLDFQPQGKGEPVQKDVRKYRQSKDQ